MYNLLTLNICPACGQISFSSHFAHTASCPVCKNSWKLFPKDRIEVRLSL